MRLGVLELDRADGEQAHHTLALTERLHIARGDLPALFEKAAHRVDLSEPLGRDADRRLHQRNRGPLADREATVVEKLTAYFGSMGATFCFFLFASIFAADNQWATLADLSSAPEPVQQALYVLSWLLATLERRRPAVLLLNELQGDRTPSTLAHSATGSKNTLGTTLTPSPAERRRARNRTRTRTAAWL